MNDKLSRPQLWERLIVLLRRHVHEGDYKFTDDEFVRKVYKRYDRHREEPLIDPAE
jgi:hypothetical protein